MQVTYYGPPQHEDADAGERERDVIARDDGHDPIPYRVQ